MNDHAIPDDSSAARNCPNARGVDGTHARLRPPVGNFPHNRRAAATASHHQPPPEICTRTFNPGTRPSRGTSGPYRCARQGSPRSWRSGLGRSERLAAQVLVGQFLKPALDEVSHDEEVGVKCRVKRGVLGQPDLHVGVFVGGIVVQNHVHSKAFRCPLHQRRCRRRPRDARLGPPARRVLIADRRRAINPARGCRHSAYRHDSR